MQMSKLKYTLRFAIPQDIDEIIKMCQEHANYEKTVYYPEGKAKQLGQHLFHRSPNLYCTIAEGEQGILAYSTYMKEFSTWEADYYLHMDCLFVTASARNQGIGLAMIQKMISHAVELNIRLLQWQTPEFNTRAIEFYHRLGAHSKKKLRMYLDLEQFLNKNK